MGTMSTVTRFMHDQDGGPFVEAAVGIPILITFLMGMVDFQHAFIQWNEASKAVEVGARIAAVSDPVAKGLYTMASNVTPSSFTSLSALPYFKVTCDGGTSACACTGTCTGVSGYNAAAINLIVFGRDGKGACNDSTSYYTAGMCDIFEPISARNVKVVYEETGLTQLPRTTPIPTVTVSIQNIPFHFFFLPLANLTMPALSTTVTAEALSSAAN